MKVSSIFDSQKRGRFFSKIKKKTKNLICRPVQSKPVFLFGTQRSGTTMLMFSFHFHPDVDVFDESKNNKAFLDYRIKSYEVIDRLVSKSRFPVVCFKPLADSHLIKDFMAHFPNSKAIWAYRDYRDVANSFLRKFPHATRAIRLVCENKEGGGWFQEGVSPDTAKVMREIYLNNTLSDFDLACLVWWARNRIFVEQNLSACSNVKLVKYEKLVDDPEAFFLSLLEFMNLQHDVKVYKFIHKKSVKKNDWPEVTKFVDELCGNLYAQLDYLTN